MQHPVHGIGHIAVEGATPSITIHSPAPDHLSFRPQDFLEGSRFDVDAAVCHSGIGGCHLQHRLLVSTDGHWIELAKRTFGSNVEAIGGFDDGVKSHLVLQLNSNGVQGVLQGISQ